MGHREPGSPLPPDPSGREDIMPAEEQDEEISPHRGTGSPLSPDPGGREDVIIDEDQDGTTADG